MEVGGRAHCSDGAVLYFDCIMVNILVVIFYYGFAIHYHWGKLLSVQMISLYYFLQLHMTLKKVLIKEEKKKAFSIAKISKLKTLLKKPTLNFTHMDQKCVLIKICTIKGLGRGSEER